MTTTTPITSPTATRPDEPVRFARRRRTVAAHALAVLVAGAMVVGSPVTTDVLDGSRVRLGQGEALFAGPGVWTLSNAGVVDKWGTDPRMADTDCDGFYDGAEILENTDPNDATSPGPAPVGPFVC